MANPDLFDAYFRKADLDRDGKISGQEAVAFFQGSNLPNDILAKIWQYADRGQTGSLSRAEFYNALKLVTVAQTGRQLTPDIVRAALVGPASSQIPPPRITTPGPFPVSQTQTYRPPIPAPAPAVNPQLYGHGAVTTNQMPMPQHSSVPRPNIPTGVGSQRTGMPVSAAPTIGPSSEWPNKSLVAGQSPSLPSQSAPASNADSILPGLQVKTNSLPSIQSSRDMFAGSTFQPGGESNGPKLPSANASGSSVDSLFGEDVFTATPSKPAAVLPQPKPVTTVETSLGFSDSGSRALVPTTLSPANATKQMQPILQQAAASIDMRGQGIGAASAGLAAGTHWPKMAHHDIQRYTKVFLEVDTDRDGKITGDQARELFLSWRLPREALKQIWDLSDQDHDGMLSMREFCMALYLMERFREGRTLPSGLSPGLLLDESAIAALRISEAQAAVAQHSAGINVPVWQQNPGVLQQSGQAMSGVTVRSMLQSTTTGQLPVQAQTHASDGVDTNRVTRGAPVLELNLVNQLNADEQQTLRTKHKHAEEAEKKDHILTHPDSRAGGRNTSKDTE